MTITVRNILDNNDTFRYICGQAMPATMARTIAKLVKELDKENEKFTAASQEIIQLYVNKETGQVDEDKQQDAEQAINKLADQEVEINASKLTVDMLEYLQLTPKQILELDPFIEQ